MNEKSVKKKKFRETIRRREKEGGAELSNLHNRVRRCFGLVGNHLTL